MFFQKELPDKFANKAESWEEYRNAHKIILREHQRALEVVKYLIKKGVGSTKLVAKGYGKSQALKGNIDNAKNRRIVFKIIDLNHIDQQKKK